jgi:hypothetical protein
MTKLNGKGVRIGTLGLALTAALSLVAPAFAAKPAAKAPAQQASGAGLTAAVDAAGKLRQPTAAENRALAAGVESMFKRSVSPLRTKQTADGTMSIDLGTSFLNISLAQVGADGSIQQICVDNPADANAIINAAPAYEDK